MKKRRWIMIAAAVLSVCAAVWMASGYFDVYREPAALLDGIEFGMSPSEAEAVLGIPSDTHTFTGMNDVTCTWLVFDDVTVQGCSAQIRLKFMPFRLGMVLEEYIINFPEEGQNELLGTLDALLTSQLSDNAGFSRWERTDGVSLDVNRGPVGTGYLINLTDDGVQFHGECNEYDR